jgi:hypothetical protein
MAKVSKYSILFYSGEQGYQNSSRSPGLSGPGAGLFFLPNRRSNRPSTTIDPVTAAAAAIRIRNAADNRPFRFSMVPPVLVD